METIVAPLVYFLLALSFKMAHTDNQNVTFTTPPNLGLNLTEFTVASTSLNSTVTPTTLLNSTKDTAEYTSTKHGNNTFSTTVAATENTSQHQTSQSATLTSPTGNGSLNTTTPTVQSPTLTITTQTIHTMDTTFDATLGSTVNSPHSMTTSTVSVNATEGLRLNISERNMTIIFSGMLGLFALTIVMIMFYKCKHKFQYLHQPLDTTDGTDGFVLDDDNLVISGGLYDAHPIYDNVPPTSAEPS
ncbi:sialomucin core protein 24-like [Gambusia affinis]|uniref:sialomucin core protein 24-like n=1 Tax=Gambusia affinis TaxID=33528 RepID=UPI001CDBF6D1|nr:sialomucin core protein 24-like [Gambusia affinis]